MRFFFRTLSVIFLAITVIFVVVDATRTIGAGTLQLTPVGQTWDALAAGGREAAGAFLSERVHPLLNDPVLASFVRWPTSVLSGLLALVLFLLARPRRRRLTRFGD